MVQEKLSEMTAVLAKGNVLLFSPIKKSSEKKESHSLLSKELASHPQLNIELNKNNIKERRYNNNEYELFRQ